VFHYFSIIVDEIVIQVIAAMEHSHDA